MVLGNHYYPFGLKMEGKWAPQIGKENKHGYNGKELNKEFGLNWNDYGARFYDPAIARWNGVDPLGEIYVGFSPYNYVANNPIRLIDPDGMKIGDGKAHFKRFRGEATDRVNEYNGKAARHSAKAASARAKGKDKKAARQEKKAAKDSATASSFQTVVNELDALESSEQVYNLNVNSSEVGKDAAGNITFDLKTGALNVNLKGGYNSGGFAHELKHAFQFETGAISLAANGRSGGTLFDIQDEVEAYARGFMFGWPKNPSIAQIQRDYKTISTRLSQRTLSSQNGSSTYGNEFRLQNSGAGLKGKPPLQYYKGWVYDYATDWYNGIAK